MSSDGYFDGDDDFDDAAFQQLDAIEAAALSPRKDPIRPSTNPKPLGKEDSFVDDLSFDISESELARLDNFVEDAISGRAQPVAGPSRLSGKLQTTLFGDILPQAAPASKPRSTLERTKSSNRNPFGQQAPKTKLWDQTAFAKSGVKRGGNKSKGKAKATQDVEEGEEGDIEFEQFPAPFISLGPPPPMRLTPDLLEVKHWIYPINKPKRDYQFNIVKHCLFENTLVALPTGLGKTFIAGAVMLNFYRWFPEGKVVFVAPTKPLVAQQIMACHETCGIPGGDSIELNGEVPKATRARHWREKRVFFMTPQTLINDLHTEICDPLDVVLLVVDEAHRATGDYAYNQVIRFLMAKNPHFRVLALTATPGNNPEAVQLLIDGLHISRIEIRDEESLDLKQYIHKKVIKEHIIKPNEDIEAVKELLCKTMNVYMKPLKDCGLMRPTDNPVSLHPFRPQMIAQELQQHQKRFYGNLSLLGTLARGMLYLLTGSIRMCYEWLEEASRNREDDEDADKGKKSSKGKSLRNDTNFQAVMRELETQRSRGFSTHPKMEKLKSILVQHFGTFLEDPGAKAGISEQDQTRVMVFSTHRGAVDDIVEDLQKERPLIRAARFIGQGTDKQGNKGLVQREQLEVINKFKAGEYNVLVATCIGEEGLDIGEIDVTVCYDADKAPTRMVQRFGRTGRKRSGIVHALLAEGREEFNLEKAKGTYKEVQKTITRGELYELYADVERLIPDHIKPECLERVMEIQQYIREEPRRGSMTGMSKGVKRKRNDDIARNIPTGASTSFVSVRDLIVKSRASKKSKKLSLSKDFDKLGENDNTDEEIESGRVIAPPRRTQSATPAEKRTTAPKLRKALTIEGSKTKRAKSRKKERKQEVTSSQFSQQGVDDSDDMDIESGMILPSTALSLQVNIRSPHSEGNSSPPTELSTKMAVSVVDPPDTKSGDPSLKLVRHSPGIPEAQQSAYQSMAWLVDDDDDTNLAFEIIDSSPLRDRKQPVLQRIELWDESIEVSQPIALLNGHVRSSPSLDADESVEFVEKSLGTTGPSNLVKSQGRSVTPEASPQMHGNTNNNKNFSPQFNHRTCQESSPWPSPSSPVNQPKGSMLPPDLPRRFLASPGTQDFPEPSFPIRRPANQSKKRRVFHDVLESPSDQMPPPSQRRLRRQIESTPAPAPKKTKRAKPSLLARNPNPLFDAAAVHSGDEVSEGYSDSEDDEESESDRLFLRDSPLTQVSPSYDQTLAYRQSLLTQSQIISKIPNFADRPARSGHILGRRTTVSRTELPSSSPPPPDDELDSYEIGSFVVDDDEPYALYD